MHAPMFASKLHHKKLALETSKLTNFTPVDIQEATQQTETDAGTGPDMTATTGEPKNSVQNRVLPAPGRSVAMLAKEKRSRG